MLPIFIIAFGFEYLLCFDVDLQKFSSIKLCFGTVVTPYVTHLIDGTQKSSVHLINEMTKHVRTADEIRVIFDGQLNLNHHLFIVKYIDQNIFVGCVRSILNPHHLESSRVAFTNQANIFI